MSVSSSLVLVFIASTTIAQPWVTTASSLTKSNLSIMEGSEPDVADSPAHVLSLMAGERYKLGEMFPGKSPTVWEARVGIMTPDGYYTAPSFMPPEGEETITVVDDTGRLVVIEVHIRPNPVIPGSYHPKFLRPTGQSVRVDGSEWPEYELIEGAGQRPTKTGSLTCVLNQEETLPILNPGENYPAPLEVESCEELTSLLPFLPSVSRIPEEVVGFSFANDADQLTIRKLGDGAGTAELTAALVCKVKPRWPRPAWADNAGTGSRERTATGQVKRYVQFGPVTPGTIQVTAAIAATVRRVLGIDLTVGAEFTFTRTTLFYGEVRTDDIYAYRDGQWKFVRRQICERKATGVRTNPSWVAVVDGYPPNEDPVDWTSWACR